MSTEATAASGVRRQRDRCCVLTDFLRRNLETLAREAGDVLALEEDYNRLQAGYVRLLGRVGRGVCRLLAGDSASLGVASDVLGAWLRAEDATRTDMRRITLFSRAARGIPVLLLVKRAEQAAERVSAAIAENKPHKRCKKKVAVLHDQVKALCPQLQQSAWTLQHLLYLTRALPLLRQFHNKLHAFDVLDDEPEQAPDTDAGGAPAECADGGEERREQSALYCGGPLWTRLTADVCHHRCRPQRLALLLDLLPRGLDLRLGRGQAQAPQLDLAADLELERELGMDTAAATRALLEARGAKRKASPTRNRLIGILEDEDLQPIKIPQLDPSIFKPLPD